MSRSVVREMFLEGTSTGNRAGILSICRRVRSFLVLVLCVHIYIYICICINLQQLLKVLRLIWSGVYHDGTAFPLSRASSSGWRQPSITTIAVGSFQIIYSPGFTHRYDPRYEDSSLEWYRERRRFFYMADSGSLKTFKSQSPKPCNPRP